MHLNSQMGTQVPILCLQANFSGLVINCENASKVFDTQTLAKLFEDQSKGSFVVRTAVLGHMQQVLSINLRKVT